MLTRKREKSSYNFFKRVDMMSKQLEKKPISIPQVIRNGNLDFTAESIGIVAPVYGHEVPPMVKEFMEKAAFHTDYFYMLLWKKLLRQTIKFRKLYKIY